MVDSVLQRNVFQVVLLSSRVVDEQVVGVGHHHALGKRLASKLRFLEAQPVHTCVTPLVPRLVVCGFPGLGTWATLVQGHCFVTKLTVLSFDKIEGNTDCFVTIVEVHIENVLVVVNERDNTGVHCPDPSLLPMLPSFLVLPSCGVVAGHKNGEDRLAHRKGGRRDGFECRGNDVPVANMHRPVQ
jgi:hypothetical protein